MTDVDFDLLRRIDRRALAQMVAMIWRANHRDDATEGDPKVGGHPAACASCLEIHAALHFVAKGPADFFCSKPHAAPMDHALLHLLGLNRHRDGRWFDDAESEAVMDRLRSFPHDGAPVFQSYHSELDPDNWRTLPSGTVGIPPVNSVYLALAYRYARQHGWSELEQPHFWSMMGDSEFREGSLMEVMPEAAERELANVTWIVDYNRQSLDGTRTPNARGLEGTDADRIERTARANGWQVINLRHGGFRESVFAREGGAALRKVFESGLTDFRFQTLLWKATADSARSTLFELAPEATSLISSLSDTDITRLFRDVGGHDLEKLVQAYDQSRRDERPTLIIAHTVKGRGLRCEAATGNHSAIPERDEVEELLAEHGLTLDRPFARFAPESPEGRFLARRGGELRAGIEALGAARERNLQRVDDAIAAVDGLPETLDINLKLAPLAHTQWMWGQLAAKLVRIGVYDELQRAGRPAGRELDSDERRWNAIADLLLTMAPDVGTSTNINPAMDEKVFGPGFEKDWEAVLEVRERLRPKVAPTDEAWSRHIRFEIAEANCMSAAGSFGKLGDFCGVPLLPLMTVYDFFIKRALDQLYYDLYWGSSFILLGTPSGVTLAPEGAQHSWKSDIQMPNLITWEPSFAIELDWIFSDAVRRHFTGDNDGRSGVLIRAVTRALRQRTLFDHLRRQARFKRDLPAGAMLAPGHAGGGLPQDEVPALSDEEILTAVRADVLKGGYRIVDYRGYKGYEPGENVVTIVTMGALAQEALEASDRLLERGIYADVIIASSPELLCGILGERDGHAHLRKGLGVDGRLHLKPVGEDGLAPLDAIDLAGRRVPIVSVHDGEPGLLDNLGSIVGTRQLALATRKFSKSGTPEHVYRYHGLDADSIVAACGRALAETALETVRLSPAALELVQRQQSAAPVAWPALWPDPVR
ncbi:MAG: pyruvate dehydrogenase [Planctomycetes bacterium]|nr:pyruvate dehydrogenase [Planctomycetota bacterium]